VSDWWATQISEIEPDKIAFRGFPVQELIGEIGFVDAIWLMLRGDLPTASQKRLLETALVPSIDHGPQAPSIASARMAATTGIGINNAVATGVNLLGDVHGGAGQQSVCLLNEIVNRSETSGRTIDEVAADIVATYKRESRYIPGFGHRFHSRDPRRSPILAVVCNEIEKGTIEGKGYAAARGIEKALAQQSSGRSIPMNIDGATSVIYAELSIPPVLSRGLFILARSVGILSHAYEEVENGRRIKGPIPRHYSASYVGVPDRHLNHFKESNQN
jgi:citrate synthase